MLKNFAVALALLLLSNIARPAELAIDARSQDPPPQVTVEESRVDVDPRGWWTGPEI